MKDKGKKSRDVIGRPGARILKEEGTIIKDWGGRLPVALIYPNIYYLGMSNLGIHALYKLLNGNLKVLAERVFLDTAEKNTPVALKSGRPLTDFAVLAFSISYELDYFNVLTLLKNSGIPPFAADRDESHPLIIAGGPCMTANPLPLAPFFDCLGIGEAEAIVPAMLPVLIEGIGGTRYELLKSLASLPGVYVPMLPPVNTIVRQKAQSLDDFPVTSAILTQDTELGDLFLIEAERGCQRGCRFCMVNTAYSPMRFLSLEKVQKLAWEGLHRRRRIGLVGPAVTDHPQINEVLEALLKMNSEIAISSIRLDTLTDEILTALEKGKVQTITIAPEAGSDRLRDVINKGISEDDIFRAVDLMAVRRFTQLKLYFMIGLPTETDGDVEDIARLTLDIKDRLESKRSNMRIVLNVAPFVPKAGTPFQWLPMARQETINSRLTILRSSLPLKGVKVNEESPAWSQVQGALSRGDERLAGVMADMTEITLAGWRQAVESQVLDIGHFTTQRWDTATKLPWGFIDSGKSAERLCGELERGVGS
jgi:radical SAM superfamily enzyme YgiQ (UPF0313 family)